MEPRPPADSPPTAELPSELEDITKELAALRGGVDAAIWEQPEEAPPPPPPPKRIESNLASTEHLVNVLAGLSDARDSFAAAWDAEDEEPEAPPPPPPRATKPPRPTPAPSRTNRAAEQRKAAAAASRARREQAAREVEERRLRDEARRTISSPATQRRRAAELASTRRREASTERRRALQEAQLRAECSFKPRTNLGPARVTAADGRRASKRLHQEAQLRREAQTRKRKEAQQLSEEHTFQPQLIASKTDTLVEDPSLRRPLHERVAAVERARQLRRDALEKRVRAEKHSSFKPDVNDDQRSTRMARKAAQKMLAEAADAGAQLLEDDSVPPDVAARLAADAWRRSMKRAEDIKKADEARVEAQKRLLSESKLSEGSQRIAKKFSSFEEREQMRKKAAEQRKQALEAQRARQRREQFRFTANARSQRLDKENEGTRAAKLYRDAAEVEKRKEEARRARDASLTFAPSLSEGTRRMAHVTPSNLADASFQGRKEAAAKASLKFQKQCTFKPAINTYKPPRVQKTDAERKREREARIAEERQRRDLEELNECSFQPRTNHDVPREARPMARTGRSTAVKPVVVRGLARHLELKRHANKLAEEHRTRVHNAFHVAKADEWRDGRRLTQCAPFELSTSERS